MKSSSLTIMLTALFLAVTLVAPGKPAAAQTATTTLYSFTGGNDGGFVEGGVIRDAAGNLYGTTTLGGASGTGVVFKLDPSGMETVLHTFANGDGVPDAGVIRDAAGNLYGTFESAAGDGAVYKVDPSGNETILHSFSGFSDGGLPQAVLIRDAAGNLYSTARNGGAHGHGIVFKLDPSGNETVLYSFTFGADGGWPETSLIRDAAGNLYGTTTFAGGSGYGVVFKLDPSGNETVLHSFTDGNDGGRPEAGVIRDAVGNLYGTTREAGASGNGVVFKVDPSGSYTVLHSFTGGSDGGYPFGNLIRDARGNLYGTTLFGGASGKGVVYKLDPSGNETVLHTFTGTGNDGANPQAGPIMDAAGNLYGTTVYGGTYGNGTVYEIVAPAIFARAQIENAINYIAAMPSAHFVAPGLQSAMTNQLQAALMDIQNCEISQAIAKVSDMITRTDGFPLRGQADGPGPGMDWITNQTDQDFVYQALTTAENALNQID